MFISVVRTIAQRPNSARLAGTIRASTALSQAVLATPCSRSFSLASFLRQASPTLTPASSSKDVVLEEQVPGFREPGQIPSNYEIASGLERYEYLKLLKGEDPWEDLQPIVLTEAGTMKKPIIVRGIDPAEICWMHGLPSRVPRGRMALLSAPTGVLTAAHTAAMCSSTSSLRRRYHTMDFFAFNGVFTIDIGAGDAFLLNK
ncbi:hypothetical protein BASA83_002626 [Batrachochytrium salamandrivorans]|nr:hypothetical protein BASA83_002626 [Batrachochytrium salamandrivorans]